MNFVVLDFETRNLADLKACGAWRYAEDITAEPLCLCWEFDDGRDGEWVPGDPFPAALAAALADPNCMFIAHNCGFEKAIWRRLMMPAFGWPNVPNSKWHDSLARCANLVLPLDLDMAAIVLRLAMNKDTEASKFTIALSKPDKKGMLPEITPEVRAKVIRYCKQDVRTQKEMHERIGWLSPEERQVWLLDQRVNERGFRLDLALVDKMQKIVDDATVPMVKEFTEITGIAKLGSQKLLTWCAERGVHLPNLQKETLAKVLEEPDDESFDDIAGEDDEPSVPLPNDVRAALHIRHLVGSASVKKLKRMKQCVNYDGRVRGTLQYHGAGPGLWAGRLFQPHNMPRGTLKLNYGPGKDKAPPPDMVVAAIMTGDYRYVETVIGPAVETVVSALRHTIVPSVGRELVVGDFAGIQARITLAAAGQLDKVALMASGADVYIDMAQQIYKRTITKDDIVERQVGKNSVLGLGFQMGKDKFHRRYCSEQPMSFAEQVVQTYRKEWAPCVPKLWYALDDAAVLTVHERTPHEAYGVLYALEDRWLTARLPSGRKLYYFDPQPIRKMMPWSTDQAPDVRRAWTYKAKKMGQWKTIDAFGGLLTENLASGLARDLLVHAMKKAEKENLPIVLTVHDEIVSDAEPRADNATRLKQIMEDRPGWAIDMSVPVMAECWHGDRYKK